MAFFVFNIARVSDQNGIFELHVIVEIYRSGQKPLIYLIIRCCFALTYMKFAMTNESYSIFQFQTGPHWLKARQHSLKCVCRQCTVKLAMYVTVCHHEGHA